MSTQPDTLEHNPRINLLVDTLIELSRTQSPSDVLAVFSRAIIRLQGPRGYISLSTRGLPPGRYKITRRMHHLDEGMSGEEAGRPWAQWDQMPVCEGGLLGKLIEQDRPAVINDYDFPDDPIIGDFGRPYRSLLAIPLFDNGKAINWAMFFFHAPRVEEVEDIEEALLRANLIGSTVKQRILNQELRKANDRIRHEINRIAAIQRALLPAVIPDIPGLSISTAYETFDEAGGDLFDLVRLSEIGGRSDDPRWLILIGDVSGHGPSAAVMMAMLHTLIHAGSQAFDSPARLLSYANRQLADKNIEQSFITAFAAFYTPGDRTLVYARAGHNPPVLLNAEQHELRRLDAVGGIPLGILEETDYSETELQLSPGQTLVLYTDGITEARDPDGKWFGLSGIAESLNDCSGEPDCVIRHIREGLEHFQRGRKPKDDQTILAIRVRTDTEAACPLEQD